MTFFKLKNFSSEIKKLSDSAQDLKWKKRRISKLCCKCLDASRPYTNAKNCDLWNFSNICIYFFSIGEFFHEHSRSTGQQGKGEGIYLTPLYHFHPLHKHLDISRAITISNIFTRTFFSRRKQQNSKLQEVDKQRHRYIAERTFYA